MSDDFKALLALAGILILVFPAIHWWECRQRKKEREHAEAVRRADLLIRRKYQRRINNTLRRERKKGN